MKRRVYIAPDSRSSPHSVKTGLTVLAILRQGVVMHTKLLMVELRFGDALVVSAVIPISEQGFVNDFSTVSCGKSTVHSLLP